MTWRNDLAFDAWLRRSLEDQHGLGWQR